MDPLHRPGAEQAPRPLTLPDCVAALLLAVVTLASFLLSPVTQITDSKFSMTDLVPWFVLLTVLAYDAASRARGNVGIGWKAAMVGTVLLLLSVTLNA